MFKRIFRLFQIARKLSTSGAINTINQIHEIPLPVNLFFNLISIGSNINHINVGSGFEIKIKELAKLIKKIVGFEGKIYFDRSKPDGMPRKLLDSKRIAGLGWKPKISLEKGLSLSYRSFKSEICNSSKKY